MNQPTKPDSIETHEAWDTYKTGVLPWSYRIGPNQPLQVVADAMQAELNDLRAAVAHRPAVAGSVDTPEFRRLLMRYTYPHKGLPELIAHINARLAPAAPSGEAVAVIVSQFESDAGTHHRIGWLAPEGLKVGDKLYTRPAPKVSSAPSEIEAPIGLPPKPPADRLMGKDLGNLQLFYSKATIDTYATEAVRADRAAMKGTK